MLCVVMFQMMSKLKMKDRLQFQLVETNLQIARRKLGTISSKQTEEKKRVLCGVSHRSRVYDLVRESVLLQCNTACNPSDEQSGLSAGKARSS